MLQCLKLQEKSYELQIFMNSSSDIYHTLPNASTFGFIPDCAFFAPLVAAKLQGVQADQCDRCCVPHRADLGSLSAVIDPRWYPESEALVNPALRSSPLYRSCYGRSPSLDSREHRSAQGSDHSSACQQPRMRSSCAFGDRH